MTSIEIHNVLENNVRDDLMRALNKRQCLNSCNIFIEYTSNLLQFVSVFMVSIATSYQILYLTWIGVGIGSLAALLTTYEKLNNKFSERLLKDIIAIKNGTYVDESIIIQKKLQSTNNNITTQEPINEITAN